MKSRLRTSWASRHHEPPGEPGHGLRGLSHLRLAVALAAVLLAGCENDTSPDSTEAMRIAPAEHRFSGSGSTVTLEVVAGVPPYMWTVADPEMGRLSGIRQDAQPSDVSVVNYTPVDGVRGANTVSVRDARGWTATSRMVVP